MSDRDQPLTAAVVAGRLVVSVGVEELQRLVEAGEGWADLAARITDADAFAASIAAALLEEEASSSELLFALERSADWVVESGGPGVEVA